VAPARMIPHPPKSLPPVTPTRGTPPPASSLLPAWGVRSITSGASVHNQRGTAEQRIKEGKTATHWTRLSCHRFRANEVRLLLGVIAYNLGNLLRRLTLPVSIQSWSLTSLQQRLFTRESLDAPDDPPKEALSQLAFGQLQDEVPGMSDEASAGPCDHPARSVPGGGLSLPDRRPDGVVRCRAGQRCCVGPLRTSIGDPPPSASFRLSPIVRTRRPSTSSS